MLDGSQIYYYVQIFHFRSSLLECFLYVCDTKLMWLWDVLFLSCDKMKCYIPSYRMNTTTALSTPLFFPMAKLYVGHTTIKLLETSLGELKRNQSREAVGRMIPTKNATESLES